MVLWVGTWYGCNRVKEKKNQLGAIRVRTAWAWVVRARGKVLTEGSAVSNQAREAPEATRKASQHRCVPCLVRNETRPCHICIPPAGGPQEAGGAVGADVSLIPPAPRSSLPKAAPCTAPVEWRLNASNFLEGSSLGSGSTSLFRASLMTQRVKSPPAKQKT